MEDITHFDCIIVGAGVAGTLIGYRLSQKHPDWRILILEKSQRIGGRLYSLPLPGTKIAAELGGMRFFPAFQPKTAALVEELGLISEQRPYISDQNPAFLRGTRLTVGEVGVSPRTPYKVKLGETPDQLLTSIRDLQTIPSQSGQEVLLSQYGNEAYQMIIGAGGYFSPYSSTTLGKISIQIGQPLSGNTPQHLVVGGYDQIPLTLASRFRGMTWRGSRVVRFYMRDDRTKGEGVRAQRDEKAKGNGMQAHKKRGIKDDKIYLDVEMDRICQTPFESKTRVLSTDHLVLAQNLQEAQRLLLRSTSFDRSISRTQHSNEGAKGDEVRGKEGANGDEIRAKRNGGVRDDEVRREKGRTLYNPNEQPKPLTTELLSQKLGDSIFAWTGSKIFLQFDEEWWNGVLFPGRAVTDLPLQQLWNYSPFTLLVYSDSFSADFWLPFFTSTSSNGWQEFELERYPVWETLSQQMELVTMRKPTVPLRIAWEIWPNGWNFWRPNTEPSILSNQFIHPFPEKRLWIVGSDISTHQGWVEGAIETVEKALLQI